MADSEFHQSRSELSTWEDLSAHVRTEAEALRASKLAMIKEYGYNRDVTNMVNFFKGDQMVLGAMCDQEAGLLHTAETAAIPSGSDNLIVHFEGYSIDLGDDTYKGDIAYNQKSGSYAVMDAATGKPRITGNLRQLFEYGHSAVKQNLHLIAAFQDGHIEVISQTYSVKDLVVRWGEPIVAVEGAGRKVSAEGNLSDALRRVYADRKGFVAKDPDQDVCLTAQMMLVSGAAYGIAIPENPKVEQMLTPEAMHAFTETDLGHIAMALGDLWGTR